MVHDAPSFTRPPLTPQRNVDESQPPRSSEEPFDADSTQTQRRRGGVTPDITPQITPKRNESQRLRRPGGHVEHSKGACATTTRVPLIILENPKSIITLGSRRRRRPGAVSNNGQAIIHHQPDDDDDDDDEGAFSEGAYKEPTGAGSPPYG